MLTKYFYTWVILVIFTFILLFIKRKDNILFRKEYISFLFVKWKIIVFLLSLFLISWVWLLWFDLTWDLWISIIMSILVFYTSPYSVWIFYRFLIWIDRNYINLFFAIILSFFSSSWFYDWYNYFILLWFYPPTWYANIFYSIPLYILAWMLWNLNYSKSKWMFFSFSTNKWISEKQKFEFKKFWVYITVPWLILLSSLLYFIYLIVFQYNISTKNIKKDINKIVENKNSKIKLYIWWDVML